VLERPAQHTGFKVAAGAGVDLHGGGSRRPYALAVARRRLIALDDEQLKFIL